MLSIVGLDETEWLALIAQLLQWLWTNLVSHPWNCFGIACVRPTVAEMTVGMGQL